MSVKPGVVVKEFSSRHNASEMDNDCIVKSGGMYGMQDISIQTGEGTDRTSAKKKMSLKEYQKQRGVRSYDMTTEMGRKNKE